MILRDRPRMSDIAFFERGARVAKAVARLSVKSDSFNSHCTAFLVAKDLILTVAHALPEDPTTWGTAQCDVLFDYAWDAHDMPLAAIERRCDMGAVVADVSHDWALLRLDRPVPKGFPVLSIHSNRRVAVGDSVYIIQHPHGDRKKIAFPYDGVKHVDDTVIHYDVDTSDGSSGAPVFNENWEVVAIHYRWIRIPQLNSGREMRNVGIRIEGVVQELRRREAEQLSPEAGPAPSAASPATIDDTALASYSTSVKDDPDLLYISFHPKDQTVAENLVTHLGPLAKARNMIIWHHGMVPPGDTVLQEDARRLRAASLAVVVLSPDYLHSCEAQFASILANAKDRSIKVVPLLARPCTWEYSPLAGAQPLPRDGRPLSQQPDAEQAYVEVSRALGALLSDNGF